MHALEKLHKCNEGFEFQFHHIEDFIIAGRWRSFIKVHTKLWDNLEVWRFSDNVDELIRFKDSSSLFNLAMLNSNNLSDCEPFFASSVKTVRSTSRPLKIRFWFRGNEEAEWNQTWQKRTYWRNIYASQGAGLCGQIRGTEFSVTLHTRLLQAIIFNININQKLLNCTKDILHAYLNNLTWYTPLSGGW